jgi:pimeloyl-ACP methyl ester carboxylesterase
MPDLSRRRLALALAALAAAPPALARQAGPPGPVRAADLGDGITLHYIEAGRGPPVVFVHGSLSDGGYWNDQLGPFSRSHRAIAYSRRYNSPNENPSRAGYSAVADADDLARLIETLGLKRASIVGHSYGAFTALFLASRRPELVDRVVLCEPPAVSLLNHVQGPDAAKGRAMYADIQTRMVEPMRAAFLKGDTEAGVAVFINYVFGDADAWGKMSADSRKATLRDAHEWDVMLPRGELFPAIEPDAVRKIAAPVLQMSGARSYPFLGVIDAELARLLPNAHRITFDRAGHQMWLQEPEACRRAVLSFLG